MTQEDLEDLVHDAVIEDRAVVSEAIDLTIKSLTKAPSTGAAIALARLVKSSNTIALTTARIANIKARATARATGSVTSGGRKTKYGGLTEQEYYKELSTLLNTLKKTSEPVNSQS